MWDPQQYLHYADERARPFRDLLARVPTPRPRRIVDLGCGPGTLTAHLAARWPDAHVTGLDNSPEMIAEAAPRTDPGHLEFALADIADWTPTAPVDLIIANAALHWVPGHLTQLPAWTDALARGGTLALQVPGNFTEPTHRILDELATSTRWKDRLHDAGLVRNPVPDAATYLDTLARPGLRIDAWETTYCHVLHGEQPVLAWVKGSTLRPVLAALDPAESTQFLTEYGALLADAYPARPYGTVLPFRRIFAVAVKEQD